MCINNVMLIDDRIRTGYKLCRKIGHNTYAPYFYNMVGLCKEFKTGKWSRSGATYKTPLIAANNSDKYVPGIHVYKYERDARDNLFTHSQNNLFYQKYKLNNYISDPIFIIEVLYKGVYACDKTVVVVDAIKPIREVNGAVSYRGVYL